MGARCTGHCCRAIGVGSSPEQLNEAQLLMQLETEMDRDSQARKLLDLYVTDQGHTHESWVAEVLMVTTMLVPMGIQSRKNPVTGTQGTMDRHWYTCVYFDEDSGDCTVYEDRPLLCRNYPYGGACDEPDCTAKDLGTPGGTRLPLIGDRERRMLKVFND